MLSRIFWGIIVGTLGALVYVAYRRGAFEPDNMRYGMDRVREGLYSASNRAKEGLMTARNRLRESVHMASDAGGQAGQEIHDQVEKSGM